MSPVNTVNKRNVFFEGIFSRNPVLVKIVGICPAVAVAVSVKISFLLSLVLFVLLTVCEMLASSVLKSVPRWLRVAVYMAAGALVCFGISALLENKLPDLSSGVGIYLPLMAASSVAALQCEKFAVKHSVRESLLDSLACSAGFATVLLLCGICREFLGSGTLGGNEVLKNAPVPAMLTPFGGFLMLGFAAAFFKWTVSAVAPGQERGMRLKIKHTVIEFPTEIPYDAPLLTFTASCNPQTLELSRPVKNEREMKALIDMLNSHD